MRNNKKRRKIVILGVLGATVMMTGCNKQSLQVVIRDGYVETRLETVAGKTVEEILQEAEIEISDKDIISPDIFETVTQPDTQITVSRHALVHVNDSDNKSEHDMTGKTVQDVLDKAEITLGEHDYMDHDSAAYLTDGMEISIVRRKAVTLSVDGETTECITASKDVEGLLAEQGIALDKEDRIHPTRSELLSEGTKVTIERVSVTELVEEEPIEFEVQTEYSNTMYSDEMKEKTPGVPGVKEVTYHVTYVDGKEESRKAVDEKVLKEPVAQVVVQGTKKRRYIVSKQSVADCDGSGHGYYIITWSDGTVDYQDY